MLPKSFQFELERILWRVSVMERGGVAWLTAKVKSGLRGKNLGPWIGSQKDILIFSLARQLAM